MGFVGLLCLMWIVQVVWWASCCGSSDFVLIVLVWYLFVNNYFGCLRFSCFVLVCWKCCFVAFVIVVVWCWFVCLRFVCVVRDVVVRLLVWWVCWFWVL